MTQPADDPYHAPPARLVTRWPTAAAKLPRWWPLLFIAVAASAPTLQVSLQRADQVRLAAASGLAVGLGAVIRLGWLRELLVVRLGWVTPLYALSWLGFLLPGESGLDAGWLVVFAYFFVGLYAGEGWRHRRDDSADAAAALVRQLRADLAVQDLVTVSERRALTRGDRSVVVHNGSTEERWYVECRTRASGGWLVVDEVRDVTYAELRAAARVHLGAVG